jgi:hypothetical protein
MSDLSGSESLSVMLEIALEKVWFIIAKAHAFGVKVEPSEPN